MEISAITFIIDRLPELWLRTGEHLILTGVSTMVAILVGIPLGILASRAAKLRGAILGSIGILQTVPSLAMLAILLALLHKIGALPAIIALILYALLPIVRNTLAGLEGVSAETMEAADGIGMTERQSLRMVKIPLALPVIIAGIRTATVVGVGIATLSAFIGAGGLGQFINRGLALSNTNLILLGAIPAAMLALIVDFSIGAAEWGAQPIRQTDRGTLKEKIKPLALLLPLLLICVGILAYITRPSPGSQAMSDGRPRAAVIRIGSKNFTEQLILGEMMAQLIEARTDLAVERRFNLGGTMICHGALTSGEIDIYAEYTGTGLTAILGRDVNTDPEEALNIVRSEYRNRFNLEWLIPFGFNNTYAITVRRTEAERQGWERISDLVPQAGELRAGFTSEFMERPDGYPGLQDRYGLSFGGAVDLDPAIMYEAIANEEVDVICAFATDGRIAAYDLKPMTDDMQYFPPYYAAPVVRMEILQAHPEIRRALEPLAHLLDDLTMQRLNYEVDENKRSPQDAAKTFLMSNNLLE